MYSESILKLISEKGIAEGDRIKVAKGSLVFEGMLLPKIGFGDPFCLVIKLDSGYNAGIEIGKDAEISLVSKRIPKEAEPASVPASLNIHKEKIPLLACGGTIASKIEYDTGAVRPSISAEELAATFPEISSLALIEPKQLFTLSSEDMTPMHWGEMAREAHAAIKGGAEGVVLTHGTDTLGYSAAALSFMLPDLPAPVVFTGSQRSSDRGSSDNKVNLLCSVLCAKSEIAHVGVCMHATTSDDFCFFHQGTKVRKMHTSRRDAFQSVNSGPLAIVDYAKKSLTPLCTFRKRDKSRQGRLESAINPNVALIYTYPGIKPEFISSLSKYDGLVIAGTGLGHISTEADGKDRFTSPIFPQVKSLLDSGIPVVMAPQTIFGRIDMDVYSTGRKLIEAGIIGNGCDLIPETALVKLMWVLGHERDKKKVKEEMERNIAGEITERSSLL